MTVAGVAPNMLGLHPGETSRNTAPSLKEAARLPCAAPVNRPEGGWAGIEATVPAEGHASR